MGKHRFGYSGMNTTLNRSTNKTCRLRHVSPEQLSVLVTENLDALQAILQWNEVHQIGVFRVGSGIIPFGSQQSTSLDWGRLYSDRFAELGQWAENHGIRLSMQPGRFVNINSPNPSIFESSVFDLTYHTTIMGSMMLSTACKIVIHVGGIYDDKENALHRFIKAYGLLPDAVRRRLALANDERLYTLNDVWRIYQETGIPIVVDTLAHTANHNDTDESPDIQALIKRCAASWNEERDGPPLIHYASPKPSSPPGTPAESIDTDTFLRFLQSVSELDFDVILDCQDKEQSVLRIQQALGIRDFSGLVHQSPSP